jgi:Ca-activated chloride channel family protein
LAEALRPLHDDDGADRLKIVLFLTDGQPTIGETSADAIAMQAARMRGTARVFTFGLGGDVNVSLLEQLALQGRGTAQFVRPSENVERAVSVVSSRLTNPIATDVRISADGVQLNKLLPGSRIDIFAGQNVVILARYSGSGSATLRFDGNSPSGPIHWTQRVDFPRNERNNPFIGRLWATQRVGYLSAERRKNGGNPELDDEIRSLGERYGIPTEFTSFLVQEHQPVFLAGMRMRGPGGVAAAMNQAVVTAAAAAGAPAPNSFEAAKHATAQRAATSLAAVDAAFATSTDAGGTGTIRRVGDRTFVLTNNIWTDSRVLAYAADSTLTRVRVQAFSAAYFKAMDIVPSLRSILALGDRVIVAGRGVVLDIGPDGATDLSVRDVAALRGGW